MRTARRVRSRASTLNPVCGFVAILLLTPAAQAASWIEFFDAGETLETAQGPGGGGPWDFIDASLEDLGGGVDDVDLWKFFIVDTTAFAVSVEADLSVDNDAAMWLFDSNGFLVGGADFSDIFPGFDDRGDGDCELPSSPCLPEFFAGDFAGEATGIYYLGFSLFATEPVVGPGLPLSGWERDPIPFQTGSYDLTMTGVNFIPIPAALWLFGSALGLLGWLKRRTS